MRIIKKFALAAVTLSMFLGFTARVDAADIKEKDIVWIGGETYDGRVTASYANIERVYGKNVIYASRWNDRKQIYFGKTGKKTGFIYSEVVPLAGGTMFFVTENRGSYEGYIIDAEGNEIYTGLKDVADNISQTDSGKIRNSKIKSDRYICGETKEGLVILDTGRDCKEIKTYKNYVLGTTDEIYKKKVKGRRYIILTNKKQTKRAFMWLSQKSGVSEIIAENLNLESELLLNRDGEYTIASFIKYYSYSLYNTKGKLIWNGKNKEIEGVAGNLLDEERYTFNPDIDPFRGVKKSDRGTKIILKVRKNGKYGLVRDDGKQLLAYKYPDIDVVYKDMAVAEENGKYYLVNYKGKRLTKKNYGQIYSFHGGRAAAKYKDKFGVIFDTGRELIKPEYDNIIGIKSDGRNSYTKYGTYLEGKDISEGMILEKDNRYIYEDKNGRQRNLIRDYESIQNLSDPVYKASSLFLVTYDGKFGIMGADGKEIHKPEYEFFSVLDKKKGIFSLTARKHGKSGDYFSEKIIDSTGKKIFEISHVKSMKKLSTGEYLVIKDKLASKDKNTEQIFVYSSDWKKVLSLKNKWEDVTDYKDGLFIVGSYQNYGLADSKGKMVLPEKYYELKFKGDSILLEERYENVNETGFLVR